MCWKSNFQAQFLKEKFEFFKSDYNVKQTESIAYKLTVENPLHNKVYTQWLGFGWNEKFGFFS